VRLLLASLALATLAACGPIQSTAALIDADVEVEAARSAQAASSATYEFVSAEVYLHKAREVSGRAEYESATRLATRAQAFAKEARKKAASASNRDQVSP
jgi:hypothetical protein